MLHDAGVACTKAGNTWPHTVKAKGERFRWLAEAPKDDEVTCAKPSSRVHKWPSNSASSYHCCCGCISAQRHPALLLQAYANNLVDHHLILDLLPPLARAFFSQKLPASLSHAQAAILLSLGLQMKEVSGAEHELQLPANQVLALFNKVGLRLQRVRLQRQRSATVAWLQVGKLICCIITTSPNWLK